MRHLLTILLVAGCACHQNCGDNASEGYARFLDERAVCDDLKKGLGPAGDIATCEVGSETWLCEGGSRCRVVGQPVIVRRVQ